MIRRTLPTLVNPPDTVCLQLQVPNDPHYIAAVWGAIFDLTSAIGWENDAAHTALLAASRMRQMYVQAQLGNCPPVNTGPGFFLEDCMNIKQDPDNPCLLREVCPDGSLGCTVFDASLCKPNPAPGGGTTPPGGGQCNTYKVDFQPGVQTPLPFVVNSGDTIEVQGIQGAGTDNGGTRWSCPDGEVFVLGACAGSLFYLPGDPLPSAPHMDVLFLVNGAYHQATGTFTVPPGIVNLPIFLVLNTASAGPFAGSYRIAFQFCNNSASTSTWCQVFDFTVSPHGWNAVTGLDGNGQVFGPAVWSPGVGWILHPMQPPPSTTEEHYCNLHLDLGAVVNVTYAAFAAHVFHATGGTIEAGYVQGTTNPDYLTGLVTLFASAAPAYNTDFGGASGPISQNVRYIRLEEQGYSYTGADDPIVKITSITLKGTGANPFAMSNCS